MPEIGKWLILPSADPVVVNSIAVSTTNVAKGLGPLYSGMATRGVEESTGVYWFHR
jgi:hypothetical protein